MKRSLKFFRLSINLEIELMKKQTGIWIDGTKAIIVKLQPEGEVITEVEANIENRIYHGHEGDKGGFSGGRHGNNEKTFEERKKNQMKEYLDDVVEEIKDTEELYVFGPAEVKDHLQKKIREDKHSTNVRTISTEACDALTQNQIVAKVKSFFKV